jgi:hypothetical protein
MRIIIELDDSRPGQPQVSIDRAAAAGEETAAIDAGSAPASLLDESAEAVGAESAQPAEPHPIARPRAGRQARRRR